MRPLWAALLASLALAGCGARAQGLPYPIEVENRPVAADKVGTRVGALTYVGGFSLKARGTDSFGGLSGFDVAPDGRFVAVSDAGDLVRGRLGLQAGVTEATIERLTDEHGVAFQNKNAADAEGLSLLDDGGFAVSFEQDHRVLVYPLRGPPRRLPGMVGARVGPNQGFEALALWRDPARPGLRFALGAERGDAWSCGLEMGPCPQIVDAGRDNPGRGFRLTGLDALPDGRLIALYRSASLLTGLRASIAVITPGAERPVQELARLPGPIAVDNMESVAAVPNPDGSIRLYVLSDDNFAGWQRTLLLAFDWRPSARDDR
jgi:hypothetical protein